MGHGEDQSLEAFWESLPNADRAERRWLAGPRITQDDLRKGSGRIERCRAAVLFAKDGDRQPDRQSGAPARAQGSGGQARGHTPRTGNPGPLRYTFGKHSGSLAVDVRESDPGYWRWSLENVPWWRAKVEKAGLLDEEDAA